MVPQLQGSWDDLEVCILLQVVVVVETAWTSRLHVGNPLPLYRPRVRHPHVGSHIIFALLLHSSTLSSYMACKELSYCLKPCKYSEDMLLRGDSKPRHQMACCTSQDSFYARQGNEIAAGARSHV